MYQPNWEWVTPLTLFAAFLFVTVSKAHEVTFDAKICVCIGNLAIDGEERVDEADLQMLLDCFNGECSAMGLIKPGKECADEGGCPADLNNNHLVGEGDLRILLSNWGDCPVPGDVNDDGDVDLDDVEEVLDKQGLDCRADLDRDGRVSGNDMTLAEAAWFGGDGIFERAEDVDGNEGFGVGDLLGVIENLGLGCRADIDWNGTVECQDYDYLCNEFEVDCTGLSCP